MFISVASPERAKELSEKLYALSRPNPDPQDITKSLINWITHPETGAVMADIPDGIRLPVAVASDPKILATLLQPFVDTGKITAADVKQVETKLTQDKGKSILLTDILPDFWLSQSQTYEQLKEAGWFPDPVQL